MSDAIDKRALKILHDTYWSQAGWKPEDQQSVSAEDFSYAKSKGVMFDLVHLDHEEAVHAVRARVESLDRRVVVDAFLASLSTRRLDWRSVLGSYAVFQHLAKHEHDAAKHCSTCGFYAGETTHDVNILNFERTKWGGVRHQDVVYAAMDLGAFGSAPAPIPTREDISIFGAMIDVVRSAEATTTSATLERLFPKALKANKNERNIIVAILGFCDVFSNSGHPGFSDAFIPVVRRPIPNYRNVEMPYPACWWRGGMGVNESRLQEYFGHVL